MCKTQPVQAEYWGSDRGEAYKGSAHKPPGTAEKRTNNPETKKAGSERKQVHINPMMERVGTGARELKQDHRSPVMQRSGGKLRQVHASPRHRGT